MTAGARTPFEVAGAVASGAKSAGHEWLSGGAEMSALIRTKDWAGTALGPIDGWPSSLRTTVSLCLASNFPINIIWGPEAVQIYNSGYREVCGAVHPRALGESYRVTWASAWPAIGAPFEAACRGETSFLENQGMFLERNGYLEETFFTFSLSPIRDDMGAVAGVFHPVTETTLAVLSGRRTRALRDLAVEAGTIESMDAAVGHIVEGLSAYRRDVPFALLYRCDADGGASRLLASTGMDALAAPGEGPPAAAWPFQGVMSGGAASLVTDVVARVGEIPCGDYPEATTRAFVVPVRATAAAAPFGFAVIGVSTRLPLDDAYRQFVDMLGNAIGTIIGTALAYEAEKRRADELAELDAAKTSFFSNVSHEFRTPLTLMLGPLEDSLVDTQEPLPPGQQVRQELIQRNALRLLKLVNTLLEFSRIQAGRADAAYQPTDLPRLTADLAGVFRAAMEKAGLQFRVDIEDLGQPVFVDHDMWEKIVLNLLSNAFKFTLQGEIVVTLDRHEGQARLSVRDTGSGIAAQELPRLFQRFHRVEGAGGRTYEGSGIGLALVQELVKLHGGTIQVESREGDGSNFQVLLPFGSEHLPAAHVREAAGAWTHGVMRKAFEKEASAWLADDAPPAAVVREPALDAFPDAEPLIARLVPSRRRHILVVEDNADMRSYLSNLLQSLGEVHAVGDGNAALLAIAQAKPDLVISDVMMPGLDGLGLMNRLRGDRETEAIPIMLLSAKAGEESRVQGLLLGADDYLVKPFSARELLARAMTQLKLGDAKRVARAERNRLQEFFLQAPLPMAILTGAQHRFVLANTPYALLVGRDVVGKTVAEAFDADVVGTFVPLLDEVYRTGHAYAGHELPFCVTGLDGVARDSFLDISYQPFREPSGEISGVLAIVLDVTEQVHARQSIKETIAQLTEERSLREQFVLTLAHDLRTPLQVVQMAAALIPHHLANAEKLAQVAQRIHRNATTAEAMIVDLLDANRLKAGEKMPVTRKQCDLGEVFAAASVALHERYGARFEVLNAAGAAPGLWDGPAIRRVIDNLAGNAIKYGTRGTPITLKLAQVDGAMELAVHNEGTPIPADEQAAIFTPFYRTHSATAGVQVGWGVGLTLVKAIAEAHGGAARVQSGAVGGTTFFVRLPIQTAD